MIRTYLSFFVLLISLFLIVSTPSYSQNNSGMTLEQIIDEIKRITEETDWLNESAANAASKRIEALTEQMPSAANAASETMEDLAKELNDANNENNGETEENKDDDTSNDPPIDEKAILNSAIDAAGLSGDAEMDKRKKELFQKIIDTALSGEEYPDVDLAKPVRDDIVEEYNEEHKKTMHPGLFNELGFLLIDFSNAKSSEIIKNIETYTEVTTLIITGGKNFSAPVDLASILNKCTPMKLQKLYIINFRNNLKELPEFNPNTDKLKYLGLFNNQLSTLPSFIFDFNQLETLHIDKNPVSEISASISKLPNLKELGIVETQLSENQIKKLKRELPNCKILVK